MTHLAECTGWSGPGAGGRAAPGFAVTAATVGDVLVLDVSSESPAGRAGSACPPGQVLMYLVRRGAWHLHHPDGATIDAPAGSFVLWPAGPPPYLQADAGTAGTVLVLPALALRSAVPAGQVLTGPARSAEARLLIAHARALPNTAGGLSRAGTAIARDALLQLTRAVLSQHSQQPAGTGPGPALTLAREAMAAVDSQLADPGLSPALLAAQLHVSVRTLHRAFAAAGEPAGAYIRRRRLEQAHTDLTTAPPGRAGVADIAARWQFADASHFIRAFKKQYGDTPARFARPARPAQGS